MLPWDSPVDASKYDGLFVSNGPGDPGKCLKTVNTIGSWIKDSNKPLFGICLGHQLTALAIGCCTYKLKYGNRGHNQPCTHKGTGNV